MVVEGESSNFLVAEAEVPRVETGRRGRVGLRASLRGRVGLRASL